MRQKLFQIARGWLITNYDKIPLQIAAAESLQIATSLLQIAIVLQNATVITNCDKTMILPFPPFFPRNNLDNYKILLKAKKLCGSHHLSKTRLPHRISNKIDIYGNCIAEQSLNKTS